MSHTKDVLIKLQESGPEALTHDELLFCRIIQKIEYCKECKNDIHAIDKDGNRICPICSSREFITEELDVREYRCSMCDKNAYPDFYNTWTKLPFINTKYKTFYCGCMGWD